jgi:hypothetical protein
MASQSIRDKKASVFDTISAFRSLLNDYPKFKSPNITNDTEPLTFSLELFSALGSQDQLQELLVNIITTHLKGLEDGIKALLKRMIREYISCNVNPSVINGLVTNGIDVTVDEFDITKLMQKNPAASTSKLVYFDVPGDETTYYLSKDFNVFIWWLIKIAPISDTTYTPQSWFQYDGHSATDPVAIFSFYENKQINGGDYYTNVVNMRIPPKYTATLKMLHTWNSDFIDSIQLFDVTKVATEITGNLLGKGSLNLGSSKTAEEIAIENEIKELIDKLSCEDSEIDNSFFTFDTSAYADLLEQAEEEKRGNGGYSTEEGYRLAPISIEDLEFAFSELGNPNATLQEQKEIIANGLDQLIDQAVGNSNEINESDKLKIKLDLFKKLITELSNIFTFSVLSPKIYFLLLLNLRLLGINDKYTALEFIKNNLLMFKDIVSNIKDMILDIVLAEIKKMCLDLGKKFAKELAKDIMEKYRKTLTSLKPKT